MERGHDHRKQLVFKRVSGQALYSTGNPSFADFASTYHGNIGNSISESACPSEEWVDMTMSFWGLVYLTNESNFDEESLRTFLSPLGPTGTIEKDEANGVRHIRFLQKRMHRIEVLQADTTIEVLPSWCSMWPYPDNHCSWPQYTSAFWRENSLCFWPTMPGARKDADGLNATLWRNKFTSNSTFVKRIMVSGGFFDNFWHAAAIINTWCNVKHQEDIHFLVQTSDMPSFVQLMATALGIESSRIIHHTGPVMAESVLLAPYFHNVDWSCLHATLSGTPKQDRNFIVVYLRNWEDPNRNIPENIHLRFVSRLSNTFRDLEVKTFSGNETFEETRTLFQRARVVIGPHGAGLVNLIFCKEGTPVIELTIQSLVDRPWQAMGGQTFGLQWWPVLLSNFSSEDQIFATASIVKYALLLS